MSDWLLFPANDDGIEGMRLKVTMFGQRAILFLEMAPIHGELSKTMDLSLEYGS